MNSNDKKSEIGLKTHLSAPPQVMSRIVGDEIVLLDIAKGTYFGLDGVGKRIWESVADGQSLAQTAITIAAEFDVEDSRAETDVVEFANNLLERELLRIE